jgi:ribosomal biogenesis protein LAS1
MVNGITDSLQRGKVAASVSGLADSAGLSRLLVDIRHAATHNELPTLASLRLGARHALQWLAAQYW